MKLGLSLYIPLRRSRRSTATVCEFSSSIPCPKASRYVISPAQRSASEYLVAARQLKALTIFMAPFFKILLGELEEVSEKWDTLGTRRVFVPCFCEPPEDVDDRNDEEARNDREKGGRKR